MERTYLGAVVTGHTGFGIMFPDVPGVITCGDTPEELAAMAREALELQLAGVHEDGDLIPEPTVFTIEDVRREYDDPDDPLPEDEEWAYLLPVTVTLPPYPETINISVEADVIREVDRVTTDRRAFITEATRRELARLKRSA